MLRETPKAEERVETIVPWLSIHLETLPLSVYWTQAGSKCASRKSQPVSGPWYPTSFDQWFSNYLWELFHDLCHLTLIPDSIVRILTDTITDLLNVVAHGFLQGVNDFSELVSILTSELLRVLNQSLVLRDLCLKILLHLLLLSDHLLLLAHWYLGLHMLELISSHKELHDTITLLLFALNLGCLSRSDLESSTEDTLHLCNQVLALTGKQGWLFVLGP